MLFIAKGFIYIVLISLFILILANIIYGRSERRRSRRRVSSDVTYRSTKSLMRSNSTFPPILHYDEALKKGGKGNDS